MISKIAKTGAVLALVALSVRAWGGDVGMVQGTLVDSDKKAVPAKVVSLEAPNREPVVALSDSQGRFQFLNVPYGKYRISVRRSDGTAVKYDASVQKAVRDLGVIEVGPQ
jgi:hypothetical protein